MTKPKVIHVTTTDISLELLLGPQLRAFAAAGYEVVGASAPGPYVEALETAGIRHIALKHSTRSMDPLADLRVLGEYYRMFRRERPAIVHTHNPKPGWFARPAARAARVPHVVNTVHGLYATPEDHLAKRAVVYGLERFGAAMSQRDLVQNEEDVATLRGLRVPQKKLVLLGNGIDLTRFDPAAVPASARDEIRAQFNVGPDEVLVGAVGRLVWEKGLSEVFEAARLLRSRCPKARVVVVGPLDAGKGDALGPDQIQEIAAETGIVFPGARSDVEAVYAALDLYVLASYREGFPRSAMEAAAMGLPVIATNIRGCRQVVDDAVTGSLVSVRDASALAAAIEQLVDDPKRRQAFAAAARAKAKSDFDQQRCIDITIETYEQLLAQA